MTVEQRELLRRWSRIEALGIAICETIAEGSPEVERASRWRVMARLERGMRYEIGQVLLPEVLPAIQGIGEEADAIASAFFVRGPRGGCLKMADEVRFILQQLQDDLKSVGPVTHPIFDLLIRHEKAWLHFLYAEAAGDTRTSLFEALDVLALFHSPGVPQR